MASSWTLLIAVHAIAAGYSILFGAWQLLARAGGGPVHRVIGRMWVAAMYAVILTSFGIRTLNGGFSWLHGLSIFTFCTVTVGLWAARTSRIGAHRAFMRGSYFGVLGAFVGVVAVPDRRIPQLAVHDLPALTLWVVCLLLTAGFAVVGTAALARKTTTPAGGGRLPYRAQWLSTPVDVFWRPHRRTWSQTGARQRFNEQ